GEPYYFFICVTSLLYLNNSKTAKKLYALAEAASNNKEKNLAMAAAGYIGRKYDDYIYYTEGFISDFSKSNIITSDIAFKYVLRFFNNVNTEDKLSDTIKGLEKIAEKYCKGSAFQLFIEAVDALTAEKPAEAKLKRVLKADPNWYLAEWLLGTVYSGQCEDEKSIEHHVRSYKICKKAGFNPEECFDASYYCEAAAAYYLTKQLAEAEKYFKKCLEIDEEHP
ncbi:MAG: tetratricopeptide repeat protein, partial [Clostridiales bacterium]|nr:tetratricopeptide repeat protein [Clostridiales bacterium]